jgi:hypothetical protein
MSIKTGSQIIQFPAFSQVEMISENNLSVFTLNKKKEPHKFVASSIDNKLRFRTLEAIECAVAVTEGVHWSYEAHPIQPPYDPSDPVPVELPDDQKAPDTMMDKMKKFLSAMVDERYGSDSKESDSFEDSVDFDIEDPDDYNPLSGYEVTDMQEDFPIEPETPPAEPETPPPPPEETPPPPEDLPPIVT